ncbi:MAG: exonuclease SbcCD subunit D [Actinomycetota bacterium]|nr:exonuclease SbcCD subunit D [Actinomycetota bacterium]MDH5224237.1 exonuclease SbcCD subunit D [Actinomycetota bacterium]MDH5312621.1 exonuclease SbcCD subunit D [Actinomycetota bacterium]
MKILHTSDWHIGKRLGRHDRMSEFRGVLLEVERIADERDVDLVLVSGDVWDRPIPPMDALTVGLETMLRLAERRGVVVVAGNHDSPELFEALRPLLRPRGVHLIGAIERPDEGALVGPDDLGVPAVVAGFPFLREGRVVDFMREAGQWYRAYADRVSAITGAYNEALVAAAGDDAVPILMAHFMVGGVTVDRGAPRGERELHMGDAYTATAQAIPAGPQYVAMGHIHAPQPVPGSPVPAQYAGSLLALDFGEAGEKKRVVVVDAEPGRLATIESVPITQGRPLVRLTDEWDAIESRADELAGSFLDLTVKTTATDLTLADRARETFPLLVKVRAWRPEGERRERLVKGHRTWPELYAEYVTREHGEAAPDDLLAAFREVLEEAADAPA